MILMTKIGYYLFLKKVRKLFKITQKTFQGGILTYWYLLNIVMDKIKQLKNIILI